MIPIELPRILCLTLALAWACTGAHGEESCGKRFEELTTPSSIQTSLKEWGRNARVAVDRYVREFKETHGLRLLVKGRDTQNQLSFVRRANALALNPIATVFNRPRQLTLPASMAGYILLVDLPREALEGWSDRKRLAEVEKLVEDNHIPGVSYTWGLIVSGYLPPDQGAKIILDHVRLLDRWSVKPGDTELPRAHELAKQLALNRSENAHFQIALEAAYAQIRSSAGNLGKSKNIPEALVNALRQELLRYPEFRARPSEQIDLLSTAFWPLVSKGKFTDVELAKHIFVENIDAYSDIARLFNSGNLSVGDALQMAERTATDSATGKRRALEMKQLFPDFAKSFAARPDIPKYSTSTHFGEIQLNNETDRWRLILRDPRFLSLRDGWISGKKDDAETLRDFELELAGISQFLEEDRRAGKAKLDEQALNALFGLKNAETTNPLLLVSKDQLLQISKKGIDISPSCISNVGEFWRKVIREESDLIKKGTTEAEFLSFRERVSTSREQSYDEILQKCASASAG